jgi:hypothetical protein
MVLTRSLGSAARAFLSFYPTLLSGCHAVQAETIDMRLNNYILEHGF